MYGEKGAMTLADEFSGDAMCKHAWEKRDGYEKLRLSNLDDVVAMVLTGVARDRPVL